MNKQASFVHGNSAWKRALSFCMALVLVLALLPASVFTAHAAAIQGGTVLYLKPNANWLQANARFAAYFYGAGDTWVSMTDSDGDGYYEVTVPAGGYTNVIFCRMNPSITANNWDNGTKWNQTSDLTVATGMNCYTVAENTWDNGGGTWSHYAPAAETEPAAQDYYLVGYINGANYGCEEDYENLGQYKFVDGELVATFESDSYVFIKTGDNANWYLFETFCQDTTGTLVKNAPEKMFVPGGVEITFTLVVNEDDTLTLSYVKAEEPTEPSEPSEPSEPAVVDYYLVGYIDGADYGDGDDYANMGDYKFVNGSVTVTFKQTSYVCVKDTDMVWYMTDGWQGSVTSATLYNTADLDTTADKLMVPAGTVTFTLVVNADGTLTLSYTTGGTTDPSEPSEPDQTEPTDPSEPVGPGTVPSGDFYLFGYIDKDNYNGFDYKFVNGKVTAKFNLDSYVYVLRQNDGKEFMTNGWMGEVSSALLYSTTVTGNNSNKLFVPGGVEVTFTLEEVETDVYRLSYTYEGAGSADDYYLFGYINGEDYGVGGPSTYKFENGTLTTTFPSDSYVGVKNGDNSVKYFTNGWLGAVTTATLYANVPLANQDKMLVPGGVSLTFTLKVNSDNTVTLSYVRNEDKGIDGNNPIQKGLTLHCWNWSYANIEANMAKIAEMGYTAIQTSPTQVMKEATVGKSASTNWWVFYQPVDFKMSTASDNALGTKAQFESMCKAADKYGIKVIVDVVANHMGNHLTGNTLSTQIPSYIRNNTAFWHDYTVNTTNYKDRYDITQHCMAGLPDLNTGNKELQNIILGYLKECIDAGADGFRFDATKHIETPEDDAAYASDFWPTVVGGAEKYAMDTYGIDLYCYGELLDNPGGDKLPILAYTKHLAVTDNSWSNCLRQDLAAGSNDYNIKGYNKAALPRQLVLWAESHDTFSTSESGLNSAATSTAVLHKTWALVAARKDAMSLYFVRPANFVDGGTKLGEASLNTGWANAEVKAINKFHNAFVGQSEAVSNSGSIAYVERGNSGVVLVNAAGTTANVNVPAKAIADGTYTDQITGNTFTVSGGKITGKIGSTGIAVVYNASEQEHSHSYTAVTTAPTCTKEGYTTYTCTCGDSYVADKVPAAGHSYSGGKCTVCGAADPDYVDPSDPTDPSVPAADYYLVGYINGANYGCEEDYENLGEYKFVDGKLTATFSADSYVFIKTGDNANWYLFETFCQDTTGTLVKNAPEKMFVPGGVEITFTLVENADDTLTLSYEKKTVVVAGKVEPKSATLSLEDEVLINLYFIVEEMEATPDSVGMLIYNSKPETADVATADTVIEGGLYNASNGRYMVSTPGIPGQYLADSLYLVAYAKDANGNYVYARTVEYSGKKYCTSQMTKGTAELKATCVALMNYGAAAQQYFAATTDYTYETLMNEEFAQYQNLVKAYSSDLLAARGTVSSAKAGTLGTTVNGFTKRSVSMSADGDFSLNYYLTTDKAVDKVTFYYWTAEQYASVSKLTLQNASGSKEMVDTGSNRYWANVSGIAAKDIDQTVYACGVYEVNGVTYSSGVFSYSIGYYCTSKAAGTDETVKPFAKAIAVYSYHARIFLESLN